MEAEYYQPTMPRAPGPGDISDHARWVASYLFALLAEWEGWVHRRVETIELIDEVRLHKHVSLDLTVPDLPQGPQQFSPVLPLAFFFKAVLYNLDLADQTGEALPVVSATENGLIAQLLLVALATALLGRDLDDAERAVIEAVPISAPADADEAVNAAIAIDEKLADAVFANLCRTFGTNFLLLAIVDASSGERRILKYGYEGELEQAPPQRWFQRIAAMTQISLAKLGFGPFSVSLPVETLGLSASYHAEISMPNELAISRARLMASSGRREAEVVTDPRGLARVHFHLEAPPSGDLVQRLRLDPGTPWQGIQARIRLSVRVRPDVVARPAFVIAWLVATMLWIGLGLKASGLVLAQDPGVAILVALPAIFGAYLGASSQHPIAVRLGYAARDAIWLAAGLAFVAAASLLTPAGLGRRTVWEVLADIALANAVGLFAILRIERSVLRQRLGR